MLRQDPDIILVGEMRDTETMATALTAAETGHLVFATLHTQDASQTIDRIIDVFPPHQQAQIRVQLGLHAHGRLHAAAAARPPTAAAAAWPARSSSRRRRSGTSSARATRTRSRRPSRRAASTTCRPWTPPLADLVRKGKITRELALNRCSSPDTFERLLSQTAG